MEEINDFLNNKFSLIIGFVLLAECIGLIYKLRWNKIKKWYSYLLPFKGRLDITIGQKILVYFLSICVAIIITVGINGWISKVLYMIFTFLFVQYLLYYIISISTEVIHIILCYDDLSFIICIFMPVLVVVLCSCQEESNILYILRLMTLLLSIASIVLIVRHIIELVSNSSYVSKVVSKFYEDIKNHSKSIRKMKLEMILTELIVLIIHLSILVYLIANTYKGNDVNWLYKDIEIKDYWNGLYYTVITFTTVGYGEIVPISSVAKFIAIIISCMGLLFSACFVGILIGNNDEQYEKIKETVILDSKMD